MLHLVSYDIPSSKAGDRRRAKVAKFLESIGLRVQMSVFELDIDPQKLDGVLAGLAERIDEAEDSVRVYPLCGTCVNKVHRLGREAPLEGDAVLIW